MSDGSVFRMLRNRLDDEPAVGDRVRLVTLSFDPERDTPETMSRYASSVGVKTQGQAETWNFLTTLSRAISSPSSTATGSTWFGKSTPEAGSRAIVRTC